MNKHKKMRFYWETLLIFAIHDKNIFLSDWMRINWFILCTANSSAIFCNFFFVHHRASCSSFLSQHTNVFLVSSFKIFLHFLPIVNYVKERKYVLNNSAFTVNIGWSLLLLQRWIMRPSLDISISLIVVYEVCQIAFRSVQIPFSKTSVLCLIDACLTFTYLHFYILFLV